MNLITGTFAGRMINTNLIPRTLQDKEMGSLILMSAAKNENSFVLGYALIKIVDKKPQYFFKRELTVEKPQRTDNTQAINELSEIIKRN